jgi:hypothetical protein
MGTLEAILEVGFDISNITKRVKKYGSMDDLMVRLCAGGRKEVESRTNLTASFSKKNGLITHWKKRHVFISAPVCVKTIHSADA